MPAVIVINGKEVRNPFLRFLLAATAVALAVIVLGGLAALVLGILGIVEGAGTRLAFPTQTVHVVGPAPAK